jgi:hypothetical protein
VDGLDRRREPGREPQDENGGDGRRWDATGSGGEESQGSGTGAAGWFVSRGGGTGRKDGGWGRRIEGKKPKKKRKNGGGRGTGGHAGLRWATRIYIESNEYLVSHGRG